MDSIDVDHMLYISFDGEDGVILRCDRDKEYCKELLADELAFLGSIELLMPPEATDKDWIEIYDSRAKEMAYRYQRLSESMAELEKEIVGAKKDLLALVTAPRAKVGPLKMQKVIRKGGIDYESLLRDYHIVDTDRYRRSSIESWRFTSS
jgi:hypothetical protein